MAGSSECPECGKTLPIDAPQGLCPPCLLNQGLAIDDPESIDGLTEFLSTDRPIYSNGLVENQTPNCLASRRDTEPGCPPLASLLANRSGPTGAASRYQLFGEIARGGMGAILRGRDPELGRDLAVKVLLEKHRNDPALVRRFIEEARISGQLQHPGIVPVHELGTFTDARPYFTMKLVTGRTLAELLTARGQIDEDRPRFLGIFEQVCQTMSYAHARGVIHRDLKPGNVMVGSFGEVQLMDWGLAKVLPTGSSADRTDVEQSADDGLDSGGACAFGDGSRFGSVLGTPAYMAPEQARGETDLLDERVDVFGLGAILCEILTGQPPYVGRSAGDVRELAAGADLTGAWRRLDGSGSDPELVAIARRCLSPLPRDRPVDASGVVSLVSGYLRGVQERLKRTELARVEAVAKAVDERTRRRLAVGLATAIVMLVATLAVTGSFAAWNRQRRSMEFERALRDVAARNAEAEASQDDPARWATARASARHLGEMLDDAPDQATRSQAGDVVAAVNKKGEAVTTDRELLSELAEIRDALNEVSFDESDNAYAVAFRAAGIDLLGGSLDETARAIAGRSLPMTVAFAAAIDRWTALRRSHGDQAGAARLMAIAQAADRDEWRRRLRLTLADSDGKTRLASLRELAALAPRVELPPDTLALLGEALTQSRDATAAVAVLRPAQRQNPGHAGLSLALAQALEQLLRRPEAIRYYMMARAIRPESGHALAHALELQNEIDEAIAIFRDLVRLDPSIARHYSCLAKSLRSRGLAREADEALDSGIAAGRESTRRRANDPFVHVILGTALSQRGRLDEAVAEYQAALVRNPGYAAAHHYLGLALQQQGRFEDAIAELREAIRVRPYDHQVRCALANTLAAQGRTAEAVFALQETVRLKPDFAEAHCNLANQLRAQGRYAEAVVEFERGHELGSKRAEWTYPSSRWVEQARRVERTERDFPAYLRDELKPATLTERLDLAHIAHTRGLHATSARLWAEAFALEPKLASDPAKRLRHAAARCAILAGCGKGTEEPPLDESTRLAMRTQAREWLEADLAAWVKILAENRSSNASNARRALRSWQTETPLAGIRDAAALAALPEAERARWCKFWIAVETCLANCPAGAEQSPSHALNQGVSDAPP
jgi:eukaryotic-like serine/threonine-protein kinase